MAHMENWILGIALSCLVVLSGGSTVMAYQFYTEAREVRVELQELQVRVRSLSRRGYRDSRGRTLARRGYNDGYIDIRRRTLTRRGYMDESLAL